MPPFHLKKEYISLKQVSKILGYHPDYIGYLVRNKEIGGKKIYSREKWEVSLEDLLAYLKKREKNLSEKQIKELFKNKEFISLQEASQISGLALDYLGCLARKKKIIGRKVYSGISWVTTEEEVKKYLTLKEKRKSSYFSFKLPKYGFVFVISFLLIFGGILNFTLIFRDLPQTLKIYPIKFGGEWRNPENIIGAPEVPSNGDLNLFSEKNSAIYRGGPLSLILSEFMITDWRLRKINSEFSDVKIKFSFALGEKEPDLQISEKDIFSGFFQKFLGVARAEELPAQPPTQLPSPDTKIIIWWSLDGQNWQLLDAISSLSYSNALNGDYYTFPAQFLKNSRDVQNLRIKFEGVIGEKTHYTTYLDSLWLEVNFYEK